MPPLRLADSLAYAAGLDAETADGLIRHGRFLRVIDEPSKAAIAERGERHVVHDGHGRHKSKLLAVLRYHADSMPDRVGGAADTRDLAGDANLARVRRRQPENGAGKLGPARSNQPGDAEDLAPPHFEVDVVKRVTPSEVSNRRAPYRPYRPWVSLSRKWRGQLGVPPSAQ